MKPSRAAMYKGTRAGKESRKRQRTCWVTVVATAIATVSFLPILTAPAVSKPRPPPSPQSTSTSWSSSSLEVLSDGPAEAAAAAAAASSESAEKLLLRQELLGEAERARWSGEAHAGGEESENTGPSSAGVEEGAGGRAVLSAGGAGAGSGGAGKPAAAASVRSAGVVSGVSREGEGGKLFDGRDRCFVDAGGSRRCYPAVFFFGTSKCGTTSLARWLDNHPSTRWVSNPRRPKQVEETGVKEAHVFDDYPKGDRAHEQGILHDKLFITAPKAQPSDVVIDYTPHYLAVAETPHRIADMYGGRDSGLKFIVTLREPASRAISSWEFKNEFNPKKGRQEESRSLATTVKDGMHRASKLDACVSLAKTQGFEPRQRDLKFCNPRSFLESPLYVSHVGKSMYAIQLERWYDLFGPENFKVVFTDDMAVDPVGVLRDVLEFLGLELTSDDESKGLPDMKRWNKITGMAYNKTKSKKKDELGDQVTDEVTDNLRRFFEPHNKALEDLLGIPLPASWD